MSENAESDGPISDRDPDAIRELVRERYAAIATNDDECSTNDDGCCGDLDDDGTNSGSCCGESGCGTPTEKLGYDADDTVAVDTGTDHSLGCGNPKAIADISPGETVLDLGAGAGFDCFLAAREVGDAGRVIGVDMTPEMVSKARENARHNAFSNVEFRLGEIAHLPVADESVDVVISNCVINLAPEKRQVFADAYRVLEPGGRLAISDIVQTAPFPDDVEMTPDSLTGCVAGAATVDALEEIIDDVGFEAITIEPKADTAEFISEWDADRDLSEYLVSATIEARRPAGR